MATVKENLIAAKALIDTPEKWGKGAFEVSPGCLCAFGAIARALDPDIDFECDGVGISREDRALAQALPDGWMKTVGMIDSFNDHPDTTHADIMALFDRAIAMQDDDRLQTRDQMLRGLAQ